VLNDYEYRIGDSAPFSIFSPYNIIGTVGCVFWFLAYGFIIYQSHKDKAPGVPTLALCLNFGWEFLGSFVWDNPIPLWRWFYSIWFLLDVAIFAQLWLYVYARVCMCRHAMDQVPRSSKLRERRCQSESRRRSLQASVVG